MRCKSAGFTLIEIIVGIVVMAIAIVSFTSILAPQAIQSVNPVMQVKAAELAQSLMNEILAKSYDENSDHDGSRWRCGETVDGLTIPDCSTVMGPEESSRLLYNDVDDYDTDGSYLAAASLTNASNEVIGEQYPNFSVRIAVVVDSSGFHNGGSGSPAKRIDIYIRPPAGDDLVFSAFRGNY